MVDYFTNGDFSKISKLTKSTIPINAPEQKVSIDYVGGITEIRLSVYVETVGFVNEKWKYQSGYPQDRIIEEIEFFLSNLNKDHKQYERENTTYINNEHDSSQDVDFNLNNDFIDQMLNLLADEGDNQKRKELML